MPYCDRVGFLWSGCDLAGSGWLHRPKLMLGSGASVSVWREEALRLAREAELDAAILDIKVGGAVVFPVAEVLRERNIPYIFATRYGSAGLPPPFLQQPNPSKAL